MYSFGNTPHVPRDPYAPAPAAGGWAGGGGAPRLHHGHHASRRAAADGFAPASGAPGSGAAGPATSGQAGEAASGSDALQGLLRDFGQFLQSAFDRLAALLGAVQGSDGGASPNSVGGGGGDASAGAGANASWTPGASAAGESFQLRPGTPLDLGNGESVLLGNDGSLSVSDADAEGGRILMTLSRNGGVDVRSAAQAGGPPGGPFGPGPDPLLDDAPQAVSGAS